MFSGLPIQPFRAKILSAQLIPAPHEQLLASFGSKSSADNSYGLLTCNFDHALFVALDEATKSSPVKIIYARSLYAGNPKAEDPLSGEAIAMMSGQDDEVVREGIKVVLRTLDNAVSYFQTRTSPPINFFAHSIPSVGEYLAKEAGIPQGDSLAYLMAPPMESILALDAALKAADVKQVTFFGPPTQTNRGGALLTGDLEACQAATFAFAQAIVQISQNPIQAMDRKQ